MALPRVKSEWPPKPFDKAFDDIEEWATWWEGVSQKLTNFYSVRGSGYNGMPSGLRQRIGAAADSFFGRQDGRYAVSAGELKLHLPVPGAIARKKANLMFSTPPRFSTATGTEEDTPDDEVIDAASINVQNPVQARLDELANTDEFHSLLLEAAESWSALGGTYLRVCWDETVYPDRAFIDKVDADHAVPEWSWGKLMAVTFWSEVGMTKEGNVLRHFQRYIPGAIEHALYEGGPVDVGMPVNMADYPEFEILVSQLNEDSQIETGVPELAAVYVPNKKPNPAWRKESQLKNMGNSDFSKDVIPLFAAIDETWSSLMRDVRQGKGRLLIAENLLELIGAGKGSGFDMNREIYSPVAESMDGDGKLIEQVQFNIRVTEHLSVIKELLLETLRRVGISPLTFGLSDAVATTATEVRAWTADTLQTQDAGQRYWGPALSALVTVWLQIDAEKFGQFMAMEENIEVEWPAPVELSDEERARTAGLWGDAASMKTKIAYLHPDWDEQRVQEEVDLIEADKKAAMPPALATPFEGGESSGSTEEGAGGSDDTGDSGPRENKPGGNRSQENSGN